MKTKNHQKLSALTSHVQMALTQLMLFAQSAYDEHLEPNKYAQDLVWAPAGWISQPKPDKHCSSFKHDSPNVPRDMQS